MPPWPAAIVACACICDLAVAASVMISFGYALTSAAVSKLMMPLADQAGEVHLDGLHALLLTRDHHVAHLAGLALTQQVADGVVGQQHLVGGDAAAALGGQQTLADDALQRAGELDLDLVALLGGEHVDDAVERLRGVVRVQRARTRGDRSRPASA